MAIYTRFGSEIELLTARLCPVWIEHLAGEIKWHYSEKKPTRLTKELTVMPCWHCTAKYVDTGEPVCDGQWMNPNMFKADDAIGEIWQKLWELNPSHRQKFEDWCNGKVQAIDFECIDQKMVA